MPLDGAVTEYVTVRCLDDWHVHLRGGTMRHAMPPRIVGQFAPAISMPNLASLLTKTAVAVACHDPILAVPPEGADFQSPMTRYLRERTASDEVERGHAAVALGAERVVVFQGGETLSCLPKGGPT